MYSNYSLPPDRMCFYSESLVLQANVKASPTSNYKPYLESKWLSAGQNNNFTDSQTFVPNIY